MTKNLQSTAPTLNRGEAKIILRQLMPQSQEGTAPWTDMVVKEASNIAQRELFALSQSDLSGLSPKLLQKLRDSGHVYVVGEASSTLAGNCIGEATFVSRNHVNYAEEPIYRIDGHLPNTPLVEDALKEQKTFKQWFIDLHAIEKIANPTRDIAAA